MKKKRVLASMLRKEKVRMGTQSNSTFQVTGTFGKLLQRMHPKLRNNLKASFVLVLGSLTWRS